MSLSYGKLRSAKPLLDEDCLGMKLRSSTACSTLRHRLLMTMEPNAAP